MNDRKGHSLIEMLVVLIIVGVLVAVTVPAVQRSRESARRTQCVNHQSELAKAVGMYAARDTHGHYPGFRALSGDTTEIGWAPQIFSFLGRNDLDGTQASFIEVLACPSDQSPRTSARLNYVVNGGQSGTDSPADGIFFDHAKPAAERVYMTKDDFRDGLRNTLLLAENLDATDWNVTDELNQCILWPLTAGNGINQGAGARPSSHHPGGFVAAFADGAVKFMNEVQFNTDSAFGTDASRYVAMLTPGGNDASSGGGGGGGGGGDSGGSTPPVDISGYYAHTSRNYDHLFELGPLCRVSPDPEHWENQSGYTREGPDSYIWEFDDLSVPDWNDMILMFDPQSDGSIRVTHIAGDYLSAGNVTLVLHAPDGSVLKSPFGIGDVYVIPAPN